MKQLAHRWMASVRRDTVLWVAVLLAAASWLAVGPGVPYEEYIDWDTLALLFSLMAVTKGMERAGLFAQMGNALLAKLRSTRQMMLVLVFLPFFCSMLITNDVSLIAFVPFALAVLEMAGQQRLAVPLVVLQTAAANLGSMLTPMGNPQNLYLYGRSGMGFGALCALMAPYVAVSGVALAVLCVCVRAQPAQRVGVKVRAPDKRALAVCAAGFALCLAALFGALPPLAVAALTAVFLLAADRPLLRAVDYSLLGTFLAFFIFIGNVSSIGWFRDFLAGVLAGREVPVAVLASQVTSNVPAALLLAGFSQRWDSLIVGCNLGGLGTLIASMASLISYKLIARAYPQRRGRYLAWFTLCNAGLLALLPGLWLALGGGA